MTKNLKPRWLKLIVTIIAMVSLTVPDALAAPGTLYFTQRWNDGNWEICNQTFSKSGNTYTLEINIQTDTDYVNFFITDGNGNNANSLESLLDGENTNRVYWNGDFDNNTTVSTSTNKTLYRYGTFSLRSKGGFYFKPGSKGKYIIKMVNSDSSNENCTFTITKKQELTYQIHYGTGSNWTSATLIRDDNDGKYKLTVNHMPANQELGVKKMEGTSQVGWYSANNNAADYTVPESGKTIDLKDNNNHNIVLPNLAGEYNFVLTLNGENPSTLTITPPSSTPASGNYDYYLGSSLNWSGTKLPVTGNTINFTKTITTIPTNGVIEFGIKVTNQGSTDKLDWYWRKGGVKNSTIIDGTYDLDSEKNNNGANFCVKARKGTYNFEITLDETTKLPKRITITAPDAAHPSVFLGANSLDNLESPDFEIRYDDEAGEYKPVKIVIKNANEMIRFSKVYKSFENSDVLGPNNEDVTINSNSYTTTTGCSKKVYKFSNTGEYLLQINSYDGANAINFTVSKLSNYYFVGDLNDWFSMEFTDPSYLDNSRDHILKDGLYENLGQNWQFRKVTAADIAADGDLYGSPVTTDWYIFDSFPGNLKKLTGQFQIVGQGSWTGEVYCNKTSVNNISESNTNLQQGQYNEYHAMQVNVRESQKNKMKRGNGQNFHLSCNAVENAKIYFKPGATGTCDMFITGRKRNYHIYYATTEEDEAATEHGDKVRAKINPGKPNENNYCLPGIRGLVDQTTDGVEREHMNTTGIDLVKIALKDNLNLYDQLVAQGVDDDNAHRIVNNLQLPNLRGIDAFEYLYITKIPNGFAKPAGWKYNMNLTNAIRQEDTSRTAAINDNNIYYLPGVTGVSVYLDDSDLESLPIYDEYDIEYWYRVYNTKVVDGNYQIVIVDYGNGVGGVGSYNDFVAFEEDDVRTSTYSEPEEVKYHGWHKLGERSYTLNETDWRVAGGGGGVGGLLICPVHHANAYVQFARVARPKSSANGPRKETSLVADTDFKSAFESTAEDLVTFIPEKMSFDDTELHSPFNGEDLLKVLTKNDPTGTWTGVENIEIDEPVLDAEDVEAAPAYYNLQGVRVNNPTNGLYIVVKGGKSKKVIF